MFMIGDFVRVLRAADIPVSTAETLDAARALEHIGVESRVGLHDALAQCLAKTTDDKARFDICFDEYFAATAFVGQPAPPLSPEDEADAEAEADADAEAEAESGDELPTLAQDLLSADNAALMRSLAAAGEARGLANARFFTQQGLFTRAIMDEMGLGELEAAQRLARVDGDAGRLVLLGRARGRLLSEVRDYVAHQIAMRTRNAGRLLREDALSRVRLSGGLDVRDEKILTDLTRRLARRLATRHARRRFRARRGQLDVRRTLRHNQAHDGLLFDLAWRRRPVRRSKLVILCDVSGSVAAVARFFLTFLYSLGEVMPATRSFVFSGSCGEVSDLFVEQDIEVVLLDVLKRYGGGSTDYGHAFSALREAALEDVDHRTSLIILGDARSNYGDPGHLILREFYLRAKRVIWLNPEPRASWDSGDSEMRRLGAYVNRAESCASIRQLERVVDDILRYAI